jgi:AraC-like DNA-binding protein
LPVDVAGVRVIRWRTDELYTGMKEAYAATRVESGRSRWMCGGRLFTSGPGSLQLLAPGDVHRDLSRDGATVCQIVGFASDFVERVTGAVRVYPQPASDDPRAAPFRRLHDAIDASAAGDADRLSLETAVAEAVLAFGRFGDARCGHTRPVRRARELLRERLAESVTLDELAAHAGLDKFHLCRAFRAQVGLPPHAYLTRLRIMRAKELLVAGVRPSEIAPRVGLYDQSQLNRHFRRLVGTTPGEFARRA